MKEPAAKYAAKVAKIAQGALAFERAVRFYRFALDLKRENKKPLAWQVGLADALSSDGHCGEAAEVYLVASKAAGDPGERLSLERRAAEEFLISGHVDQGFKVIRRVLKKVKLALPRSPWWALLTLISGRSRLRWRGLGFRKRTEDPTAPNEELTPEERKRKEELLRVDVCWTVAEGLAVVDTIYGASFQTRHMLLALRAGEPGRIGRALAFESGFLATAGESKRADRLLIEAKKLAFQLDSAYLRGLCVMIASVTGYHAGRWKQAAVDAHEAERILSEQLSFVSWHLNTARLYHIHILAELGEVNRLCSLSKRFLEEALSRGNLVSAIIFRTGWSALLWLRSDDVAGAQQAVSLAKSAPPPPRIVFRLAVCAGRQPHRLVLR